MIPNRTKKRMYIAEGKIFCYIFLEVKQMLDNISINSPSYRQAVPGAYSGAVGGASFGDCLASAMNSGSITDAAPDRWAYKFSDGYAVNIAIDFLRENFGINANERKPTHTITEEQKAWLLSRHDLNNLCGDNFPDLGEGEYQKGISSNFKADLVYLGIISPDEAKKLGKVPIYPGVTFGRVSEVPQWRNSGTGMELIDEAIAKTAEQIDRIEQMFRDNMIDRTDGENFIARAKEHITLQKTLYDIMMMLYS